MNKKIIIIGLLIAVVVMSSIAVAAENINLNLSELIQIALNNNKQSAIDDYTILEKESAYKDAIDNANKSFFGGTPEQYLNKQIEKMITPSQAAIEIEISKMKKVDNEKNLKLDIYEAYQKVLLDKANLIIENQRLEYLEQLLEIQRAKLTEGTISATDIYDSEYNYDSQKVEVKKLENTIDSDLMELKRLMSLSLTEDEIQLDVSLVLDKVKISDFEAIISDSIENNIDVFQKNEDLKFKAMILELASERFEQGDNPYDKHKLNYETANAALNSAKKSLEAQIRNANNELITKYENYLLKIQFEDILNKKLDTYNIKFDMGVISKQDLINLKLEILDATKEKNEAIYQYNIQASNIKRISTIQ